MAINGNTLRLLDGLRISILEPVDQVAADLIQAWGTAWNELATEWDAALNDLVDASTGGRWPSRRQIDRAQRVQRALAVTRASLTQLTQDLPVRVVQVMPDLTAAAVDWSERLAASQYPSVAGSPSQVVATFNRVDQAALDAIVKRTTGQITSLSLPLSSQAEAAMRSELIRGIALGDNPRVAASRMLARVEGAFYGGRNRALVIARTEMIDAHRAASMEQQVANPDTLAGWQWVATLDRRTCPSCWAMDGSQYPVTEPGPLDHQQGRCSRVPVTKSWRDLGFNIDEPPSARPAAQDVFDQLPREQQVAVMGQQRLNLLDSGQITFADLAKRRSTDGWRDSFAPTPVADLLSLAS